MAKVVGATPDQLREVGRADAADELQSLPFTQSITGVGVRPAVRMEAKPGGIVVQPGAAELIVRGAGGHESGSRRPQGRSTENVEALPQVVLSELAELIGNTIGDLILDPTPDEQSRLTDLANEISQLTAVMEPILTVPEARERYATLLLDVAARAFIAVDEHRRRSSSDDTESGSAAGIEAAIAGVRAELEVEDGYQRGEKPS